MPRIGRMDKIITFERRASEPDGQGGTRLLDWVQVGGRSWAEIEPVKASKMLFANTDFGQITHVIRIYRREDLDKDCRVRWGTKTLEIVSPPITLGRDDEYLEIMAKEVG